MSGDLIAAHGVGGQQDLPISLSLAIAGAVAALVISFAVLALAWRKPRYESGVVGTPRLVLPEGFVRGLVILARAFGLGIFAYTAVAAIFGENLLTNPTFGIFYVWLWVGIVFASFLFGPFYKAISPVRSLNWLFAKVSATDPKLGLRDYPTRLGYFPAALGLFAFVWLELVSRSTTELGAVRLWLAVYVAAMIIGGAVYGEEWFERADPFEVYSTLIGKLSIWGRAEHGVGVRSPLANLATVEVRPGLVWVVGILFGSTVFDSFRESPMWISYVRGSSISGYLLTNIALVVFCAGAVGILALGSAAMAKGDDLPRRELPDRLAHSIVPIIFGYIIAHYLTYFVEVGQRTLTQVSDPFSDGSDYFNTADWAIWFGLSVQQTLVANIKVAAVVIGHVVGAMAAHDRAISILPRRHHLTGQLPLLAAMVGFTAGGLFLLFSG